MWVIERAATRYPSRCAIIWHDRDQPWRNITIAAFRGADGEAAATRILADLTNAAEPGPPAPWQSSQTGDEL